MNVLFLLVSTGGGHYKAAEAIRDTVKIKYPASNCLIVDTLKYINPVVDRLVVGSYLGTLKSTPGVYGKLYDLSESGEGICKLTRKVNKLLSYRIERLIDGFNPSVIVCTHTFPLQMLSCLKKKDRIRQPVVAVFTDYATHPFWLHDNVDAYVVAHDHIKQELVKQGIPARLVHPYGIPVAKSFLCKKNRQTVLKALGLEDKTTVLIMGGSLGFGEISGAFSKLLECKGDLQIVAITGMNYKLKAQLERYSEHTAKSVHIVGYTEHVADYMDISDILITKPGGMTVSEALVKRLPIFIISPIPGQEERNARFLTNEGAAERISVSAINGSFVSDVLNNRLKLMQMKEAARKMAKPGSCSDIAELIAKLGKYVRGTVNVPLTR